MMVPDGHRVSRRTDAGESVAAQFERVVQAFPDRVAVSHDGRQISYAELNRWANAIAHAVPPVLFTSQTVAEMAAELERRGAR